MPEPQGFGFVLVLSTFGSIVDMCSLPIMPALGEYSSPFYVVQVRASSPFPYELGLANQSILPPDHNDWFRDQEGYVTQDGLDLTVREGKMFSLPLWQGLRKI